jgi:plastocyanin
MILSRREFTAGALGVLATPALAHARVHQVEIRNFAFVPERLEVRTGDRIRFTNHDLAPHTATADDDSWDSDTLEGGETVELTVTSKWSGAYYCAYHPQMKATLDITSA